MTDGEAIARALEARAAECKPPHASHSATFASGALVATSRAFREAAKIARETPSTQSEQVRELVEAARALMEAALSDPLGPNGLVAHRAGRTRAALTPFKEQER